MRSRWAALGAVATLVLLADQASKFAAVDHLTRAFSARGLIALADKLHAFVAFKDAGRYAKGRGAVVVEAFWSHRYAENRGAAFSFLANANPAARNAVFLVITLGALAFIVHYHRKSGDSTPLGRAGLALVLGGALGNALDRVLHGYVIDFIDWHWNDPEWLRPSRHFATFNVADACICSGLALFAIGALVQSRARRHDVLEAHS